MNFSVKGKNVARRTESNGEGLENGKSRARASSLGREGVEGQEKKGGKRGEGTVSAAGQRGVGWGRPTMMPLPGKMYMPFERRIHEDSWMEDATGSADALTGKGWGRD